MNTFLINLLFWWRAVLEIINKQEFCLQFLTYDDKVTNLKGPNTILAQALRNLKKDIQYEVHLPLLYCNGEIYP